jgi:hypothetical protein
MSRYIALLKFSAEGARNIKKSAAHAHTFDKLAANIGIALLRQCIESETEELNHALQLAAVSCHKFQVGGSRYRRH